MPESIGRTDVSLFYSSLSNPRSCKPVEAALSRPPGGSTYGMFAAAARVGAFNLGGGTQYLRFAAGTPTRDNTLSVGAVTWRRGGLAVGGGLKYLSVEDSAGTIARTLVRDLGVTLALFDVAALGLSWQNRGASALSGPTIPIPGSFHLGVALNLIDTYTSGRLLALVETAWTSGEPRRTVIGLEGGAVISGVGLIARIGHGAQSPATEYGKTAWGGGILLGAARIDYAYRRSASGGTPTHLFGVRWTR